MPSETYLDTLINGLKNNPVVAIGLLAIIVIGGFAGLLKNLDDILHFLGLRKDVPATDAGLLALVKKRGEDVIAKMQSIIDAVHGKTGRLPSRLTQQLERFKLVHQRHVEAIEKNERVLEHESHAEALQIITDFNNEARDQYGQIVKRWYDALPQKYIARPSEGSDPAYAAVARDAQEFSAQTLDVLKTIEYPDLAKVT